MHFTSLKELLNSVRDFMNKNPDAYLQVKDVPKQLLCGFEALAHTETQHWTIPVGKMHEGFSENEQTLFKNFAIARVELNKAEDAYINMIVGVKVR